MKDCREEWYDKEKKVAVTIVDVTEAAQALARGHLCGPVAAHFLTEAVASAALLGSEMSEKDETVIVQMKCTGPLGGFNVECTSAGTLRGYTEKKVLDAFDGMGLPDPKMVIGDAQYQITRSVPGRILSQGISNSLDGYLAGSLQRKACIYLEAAVSDEVEILEARGVMVEALPDSTWSVAEGTACFEQPKRSAAEESVERPERSSAEESVERPEWSSAEESVERPERSAAEGAGPRRKRAPLSVASRNILSQLGLDRAELKKTTPLSFACRCSPDRAIAMLNALSDEEKKELPPTLDITCHMCGKIFTVKTR